MRNTATHKAPLVARPISSNSLRYGITAVAIALVASSALDPMAPADSASLSRAQQAWADRLSGLAEAESIADVARSRAAEAARWQTMGEQYQQQRVNQAATDIWAGLAEYLGATRLSRTQQAEADRLTGLAEYASPEILRTRVYGPSTANIDPHVSPEILRNRVYGPSLEAIHVHESLEVLGSRTPVYGPFLWEIDPHESPEILRLP